MRKVKNLIIYSFFCSALILFFMMLFYADNKYETPPPYGKNGILTLTESALARNKPIFLIDGWLLTDSRTENLPTYIGEFSSLQRGAPSLSPHGKAIYRLTLRYNGTPIVVAVKFPELFSDYVISFDNRVLTTGTGNAQIAFMLEPGEHMLTVQTTSRSGYYSGMYFPPLIGKPDVLTSTENIKNFAYALAFFVPLVLAMFTMVLWRTAEDRTAFWFGLFCVFFSLYIAYHFIQLFHLPFAQFWYPMEGIVLYVLIFCIVRLTALASCSVQGKTYQLIQRGLILLPLFLLILYLLIPVWPWIVMIHYNLKNIYFIFTFCCVVYLAVQCSMHRNWEYRYILAGSVVFGMGLLLNLLSSNLFEPIRFFWQFEWCGLIMVILFGAMMVARNKRMLAENHRLNNHLEQLVTKRTEDLTMLLQERKAFFADMAHDLKVPLFATKGFIDAIRANNTSVDTELLHYLDQVEIKQKEMVRRVQGLNTINQLDKIESDKKHLSIRKLLKEVYASHHPEAAVFSVHLVVKPIEKDAYIFAQAEKLYILFENLIYNALKATPPEGTIAISANLKENVVNIFVEDTGYGIPDKELTYIFNRFYVGERNRTTGSGLGLYIVKTILDELGGSISVSSSTHQGTTFVMEIPLSENELYPKKDRQ